MTFTVLARAGRTAELGVASATRTLSVGAAVPAGAPGVGVIASQAWTNRSLRGLGLALLAAGTEPDEVLERLHHADPDFRLRQVGLVDALGRVAAHTGADCTDHAGHRTGDGWVVLGNLLTGPGVLDAMAERVAAGLAAHQDLAGLLVDVLRVGERAGGDRRGRQSAALLVVDAHRPDHPVTPPETLVDLRVDDHADPVTELARLVVLHRADHGPDHHPLSGG
ncbi:DUF1028 domain-containing protein [Propionibacteriaceae bacterium Y1923]